MFQMSMYNMLHRDHPFPDLQRQKGHFISSDIPSEKDLRKAKHILMIPVPAFGHLIPLLELAKRLSEDHEVTFAISEHLFNDVHKRDLIDERHKKIRLFRIVHNFSGDPDHEKAGAKNVDELLASFNVACSTFLEQIYSEDAKRLVIPGGTVVDAVIVDNFLSRQVTVCYQKEFPVYHFVTASSKAMLLKGLLFDISAPVHQNPETEFDLWAEPECALQSLPQDEKDIMTGIKLNTVHTHGLIINSTHEMETHILHKVRSVEGLERKKIFMVGPLIGSDHHSHSNSNQQFVLEWLRNKEDRSVVYVSFGTIACPSPQQIRELAEALISSGRPFVWSLSDTLRHQLPQELIRDTSDETDTGHLILNWVPQKALLAQRDKIAVFISHCGWNSTLEALSNGVCVIGWPMFADQAMNANFLAELGVGVALKGTGMKAAQLITKEQIVEVIEKVANDRVMYANATQWREILGSAIRPGGTSHNDLRSLKITLMRRMSVKHANGTAPRPC